MDSIESPQERQKWLRDYPQTGVERQEGRIYLEDFFDAESIEIDKKLYLALMHRPGLIWERNEQAEKNRTRAYLELAFSEFIKKVEKEQIKTFAEYDEKFSIHYQCEKWLGELMNLSKKNGNKEVYKEVKKICRKMA